MSVPDTHYAGDSLSFSIVVPDYPPADGWSLTYRLVPRFTTPAQAPITLVGTPNGDSYDFLKGPTETLWAPGMYGWARWVEKPGARVTLDDLDSRGQLEIKANPATADQGADNRTRAQKGLDDARAALAFAQAAAAGANGLQAIELTHGDKRVKYSTAGEAVAAMLSAVTYWTHELDAENARLAGRPTGPLGRVSYGVPGA